MAGFYGGGYPPNGMGGYGGGAPVGGGGYGGGKSSGGKSSGGAPVGGAPVGGSGGGSSTGKSKKGSKGSTSSNGTKKSHAGGHQGAMPQVGFPGLAVGFGDAKTDKGMPVFGFKSKGPSKKVVFKNLDGGDVANLEYNPDLHNLVIPEEDVIKPSKGPKTISLKQSVKSNPDMVGKVAGPSHKDKTQSKNAKDKASRLAKIARLQHMQAQVGMLHNGKTLDETYTLDPNSKAIADAHSKSYYAAIQQASMAAAKAATHGTGYSTYGGRGGGGRGRGGGGRGGGGRGRGSGP